MFIPIKVNGRGLIPRGHGLAPKSYVKADLQLIQLILGTPGLSMDYIQEDTGTLIPLNRNNYLDIYERYVARESAKSAGVPVSGKASEEKLFPPIPSPIPQTTQAQSQTQNNQPTVQRVPEPMKAPEAPKTPEHKPEEKKDDVKMETPEDKKEDFSFKPVHKENEKKNK